MNHTVIQKFALQLPGEIVTARVINPLENRHSTGKARPVILRRRVGARWLVMGLTTRPNFADGTPRQRVPNDLAYGLGRDKAAYFWGHHTWICALDVGDHIGRASEALIDLLDRIDPIASA